MHKYVRSGKFKNTNCGYALVNEIVFGSVFEAEEYCTREGLDVNAWIEADDPEVLARCQQIAATSLPTLRKLQADCRAVFDRLCKASRQRAAERDAAAEKRELGWEVYQDWVLQAGGEVGGCYDCMKAVDDYIMTLERVRRIKPERRSVTS